MSGGITIAASTSPEATLRGAAARVGDMHHLHLAEQLVGVFARARHACRPSVIVSPGGVSSTIATRGLEGLREIAKPISSAIATG